MQIARRRQTKLTGKRDFQLYPHGLQFYKYAPEYTISLEEFEKLALERLQALRIIERAGAKYQKFSNDYRETVIRDLKNHGLSFFFKLTVGEQYVTDDIYDERKRDHISHFILRLAYCKSEALRSWFLTQEVDLFKLRFLSETTENRKNFMHLNQLNYTPITDAEKKSLSNELDACSFSSASRVEMSDYYKVPFTEVLDLVKGRRVYLKNGLAYLTEPDLVSIVVSAFRSHLSQALAVTSRALPQLQEDKRLLNILNTIHERYIGTDYRKAKSHFTGDVCPEMLDELSSASFPLCMRTLHETIRKTHHLKYFGRVQYGLFLKGIGLSLEDSMRFWREEFTKTMDLDKFDRQYAYGVRYNYGKEGKRANFPPYSCIKIITSNPPGPMDCHGCPYKHSDTSSLRQRFQKLGIGSSVSSEILELAGKGHFQLACTRFFEATHGEAATDQAINHPNQYFELSQKIRKGDIPQGSKNPTSTVVATKTLMYEDCSQPPSGTVINDDISMTDAEMGDIEDLLKGI